MRQLLRTALEAAVAAGKEIMKIYKSDSFSVELKNDNSPLTLADQRANEIINNFLISTNIPVISEENKQTEYEVRKQWQQCWIVDPLDGTKEFIKKNDEFTVNIALVQNGAPVLGVIFAPALNTLYFAIVSEGKAFRFKGNSDDLKEILNGAVQINPAPEGSHLKVVGSRSHMNEETQNFIEEIKSSRKKNVEIVSKGSSLKFCLVAEGHAQIYPRFAPTMEWDTAAGQAICEAVGLKCIVRETGEPMTYNRENLLNSHFSVSNEG